MAEDVELDDAEPREMLETRVDDAPEPDDRVALAEDPADPAFAAPDDPDRLALTAAEDGDDVDVGVRVVPPELEDEREGTSTRRKHPERARQ